MEAFPQPATEMRGWMFGLSVRASAVAMTLIAGCLVANPSVAAAAVTSSATPTTGLTDGQVISVTVSGRTTLGVIGECGNAYADGTPLPQFEQHMATDCSSPATPGPWIVSGNGTSSFRVRETGIGWGNRSCVIVAPNPCYLWGAGTIPISFAQDVVGTTYDTTATAAAPSLSVAVGDSFGIRVHVAINGFYIPDGTVEVSDGANVVGTGPLSSGEAVVTVPGLAVGVHQFDVHYDGNGSFAPSDAAPVNVTVIGTNSISIGDSSMYESTSGTGSAVFVVLLNNPSPSSKVTVNYSVTAGTAVPGTDFKLQHGGTGTLTFPLGTVTQHVVVPLYFHDIATASRSFYVTLSSPSAGYELNRAVGTGTLFEPLYVGYASIAAQNVPEGDSGPYHNVQIPIVFTRPTTAAGSLTLTIKRVSAFGSTRRNGGDYGGPATKYIYYNAGTVERIVTIPIYPDTRPEADETFQISIGPVAAPPDQFNTYVTILGDE